MLSRKKVAAVVGIILFCLKLFIDVSALNARLSDAKENASLATKPVIRHQFRTIPRPRRAKTTEHSSVFNNNWPKTPLVRIQDLPYCQLPRHAGECSRAVRGRNAIKHRKPFKSNWTGNVVRVLAFPAPWMKASKSPTRLKAECPVPCEYATTVANADATFSMFAGEPLTPAQRNGVIKATGSYEPCEFGCVDPAGITLSFSRFSDVLYQIGGIDAIDWDARPLPPRPTTPSSAVFVSNCAKWRMDELRELVQNGIHIEFAGKCDQTSRRPNCGRDKAFKSCKIDALREHPFAITYESRLVDDYVTEKWKHMWQSGAIPVYMGSPLIYEKEADWPPFINALNFASAKELAAYLIEVLRNDTLWNHYTQRVHPTPPYTQTVGRRGQDNLNEIVCDVCQVVWGSSRGTASARRSPSKNVVLTSWFTYAKDPQRGTQVSPSSIEYIYNLYTTATHNNVSLVVFHTDVSQSVVEKYSNQWVTFQRVSAPQETYSTNDYRFMVYKDYLESHDVHSVLMVDASDVFFNADPFDYMVHHEHNHTLFMSPDIGTFHKNAWRVKSCYGDKGSKWDQNMQMHNAGVWGGREDVVRCVLNCIVQQLKGPLRGKGNCNMPVLNWCVSHGPCATSAVIDDAPAFVNPFRKECKHNHIVVHNKCKSTEKKVCMQLVGGEMTLRPKRGDCLRVKEGTVHLIYSADDVSVAGVEASIRSVQRSASKAVIIHFIGTAPLPSFPDIDFISLDRVNQTYNLQQFINPKLQKGLGNLNSLSNYVRFVVADLFPSVSKAMWMDADTIVNCDVVSMVQMVLTTSKHAVAAVPRRGRPSGLSSSFKTSISTSFNAGVLVMDLDRWRSRQLTNQIATWAKRNKNENIYLYGSQPPLALTIGEEFEHLDDRWNVDGLGYKSQMKIPEKACVLHWTGKHKHWLNDGYHKDFNTAKSDSQLPARLRIALVTSWTGRSVPAWWHAFHQRRADYADRHGYDLISNQAPLSTGHSMIKWTLYRLLLDNFKKYDVIVIIDADVWINRIDVPVTQFIDVSTRDILVEEWGGTRRRTPNKFNLYLQAGVIVFRTTEWVWQFVTLMLEGNECKGRFKGCPHSDDDQCCLIDFYGNNKLGAQEHIYVHREKDWNPEFMLEPSKHTALPTILVPLQCGLRDNVDCWGIHVTSGRRRRYDSAGDLIRALKGRSKV